MTKLIRIAEVLNVELYQFFVTSSLNPNPDTIEELNTLLAKANKVQLNLIYGIIKSILELTPIE